MIESKMPRGVQVLPFSIAIFALVSSVSLGLWILKSPPQETQPILELESLRIEVRELSQAVERLEDRLDSRDEWTQFEMFPLANLPQAFAGNAERYTSTTKDPIAIELKPKSETARGKPKKDSGAPIVLMSELAVVQDIDERRAAVSDLLASLSFWERGDAIKELMAFDPEQAFEATHAFLEAAKEEWNGEWGARTLVKTLGEVLGEAEGYSAANDLYRIYESELPGLSMLAARVLEKQGDPNLIVRELENFTRGLNSPDMKLKLDAIEGIGSTGSLRALPYLTPLLENSSWEIRVRALETISWVGNAESIRYLERLLDDPVAAVRDRALATIRSLRDGHRGAGQRGN